MIVLYTGRRGAGKTLTMVKDAVKYLKNGWKVFSNMENHRYSEFIKNEDILKIDKNSPIKNCVLMIDEAQILFESSNFMSKNNKNFSHFIQQIRKRNIIMLVTTQFAKRVDTRMREHTDVLAKPRFNKEYEVVKVEYIDLTSVEDDDFDTPMISTTIVYNPKPLFKVFNTKEMIQ